MDFTSKTYLERARNENKLSIIIKRVSDDKNLQENTFKIEEDTYYSAVISHSYYSIFYAAKAYLNNKKIQTSAPEEHKKTFEEFSKLVDEGIVDVELLRLYKNALIKADSLLHIFEFERKKRARFTYKTISQANKEPAEESINNSLKFFNNIRKLIKIK